MSEVPETIFDQIARLLPPDRREHFFRHIAQLRDLNPNDDMLFGGPALAINSTLRAFPKAPFCASIW